MASGHKLVIGNWKMNGTVAAGHELVETIRSSTAGYASVEIVLCPPATLLSSVGAWLAGSAIELGGQDCHAEPHGAFTGDISAEMLADLGARYVIVGHSERRVHHRESSAEVAAKAAAAFRAGLSPVICVGESETERSAGEAERFVAEELSQSLPREIEGSLVIAYEPLWAIGTGKICQPEDVQAMHGHIRKTLRAIHPALDARIIYGGSVKPENAAEILAQPGVDGVLPGGASLEAGSFTGIVAAAAKNS